MKNLVEESRLLNFVIFTFSFMVGMLIVLPIIMELDTLFTILLITVSISIGIATLSITIKKVVNDFILSEIEESKSKHINEFFEYMRSDKEFTKNVLFKDIPILDDNNEEIGKQTIYSALSDKKYYFIR
jgi:hypothetical protein